VVKQRGKEREKARARRPQPASGNKGAQTKGKEPASGNKGAQTKGKEPASGCEEEPMKDGGRWTNDDRRLLLGFLSENPNNYTQLKTNASGTAQRISEVVFHGKRTANAIKSQWVKMKDQYSEAAKRLRSTGEGQRDDEDKWRSIRLGWLDKMCPLFEEIEDILHTSSPHSSILTPGRCCERAVLSSQADFMAQKSRLEEAVERAGHIAVFYPKFHCELNWIEYYWGAAKRYTRKHCTYTLNGLRVVVPEALESVPDILIWKFYNRTQRILQVFSDSHLRSPSGPGTDYCNIRPTARVILLAARSTSSASTLVIDGFQYPRCDARCSAACCPGRVFAGVFGRVRLFFPGAFGHDFTLWRTIWCGRLLPCARPTGSLEILVGNVSAPGCTAYLLTPPSYSAETRLKLAKWLSREGQCQDSGAVHSNDSLCS
jgi:transposase